MYVVICMYKKQLIILKKKKKKSRKSYCIDGRTEKSPLNLILQ